MEKFAFRLKPGQDLFLEIETFVNKQLIQAGCIVCAVGSLTKANLRLANQDNYTQYDGHFEIVSITGTISIHGSHIHIAISDEHGQTVGGHLGAGCLVYTTAEIILLVFPEFIFRRELCSESGYEELKVMNTLPELAS